MPRRCHCHSQKQFFSVIGIQDVAQGLICLSDRNFLFLYFKQIISRLLGKVEFDEYFAEKSYFYNYNLGFILPIFALKCNKLRGPARENR